MFFICFFVIDIEVGYIFQWLQNGNFVGVNSVQYIVIDFGVYQVCVIDQNGCIDFFNIIFVFDCFGIGGGIFLNSLGCVGIIDFQ